MSRESTDTNSTFADRDISDGEHAFTIVDVTKKYKNETLLYIWKLDYEGKTGSQVLLPSMMGDLLRVLNCKETSPNKFDWDTDDVVGREFVAMVTHTPDKKGVIRQQMKHFKEVARKEEIPF